MSFARAKRFFYKDPEISVSPADYNVPILSSNPERSLSIHKCPRFKEKHNKAEESTQRCSRVNCPRENHGPVCTSDPQRHVTPKKKSPRPTNLRNGAYISEEQHSSNIKSPVNLDITLKKTTNEKEVAATSKLLKLSNLSHNQYGSDSSSSMFDVKPLDSTLTSPDEKQRNIPNKQHDLSNSTPKQHHLKNENYTQKPSDTSTSTSDLEDIRVSIHKSDKNVNFNVIRNNSKWSSKTKPHLRNSTPKHRSASSSRMTVNTPLTENSSDYEYPSTPSDEWKSLEDRSTYEYRANCRAVSELHNRQDFEKMLVQKMDNIEQTIEKFKNDFSEFANKVNAEQPLKKHALELPNITSPERYLIQISNEKRSSDQSTLKIMKNVQNVLEHARNDVLKDGEKKICEQADDIQISDRKSPGIEQLCTDMLKHIAKEKAILSETREALKRSSIDQVTEDEKDSCYSDCDSNYFENICKILSNHLLQTQDEKMNLELEHLKVISKYRESQQTLDALTDVINKLQNELRDMKKQTNVD